MKYKTLFRMLMKALGVWLFIEGLQGFVSFGFTWIITIKYGQGISVSPLSMQWWFSLGQTVAPLIQMAIALYLFFGGAWVANKAFPNNRPYCAECGYDLRGSAERCPECGIAVPQSQNRQAARDPNDLKSEI